LHSGAVHVTPSRPVCSGSSTSVGARAIPGPRRQIGVQSAQWGPELRVHVPHTHPHQVKNVLQDKVKGGVVALHVFVDFVR